MTSPLFTDELNSMPCNTSRNAQQTHLTEAKFSIDTKRDQGSEFFFSFFVIFFDSLRMFKLSLRKVSTSSRIIVHSFQKNSKAFRKTSTSSRNYKKPLRKISKAFRIIEKWLKQFSKSFRMVQQSLRNIKTSSRKIEQAFEKSEKWLRLNKKLVDGFDACFSKFKKEQLVSLLFLASRWQSRHEVLNGF